MGGHEFVSGRLPADGVLALALDPPRPRARWVAEPGRLLLALESGVLRHEGVPVGVRLGVDGERDDFGLDHRVRVAVDAHIEACAEHVLVDLGVHPRGNQRPVRRGRPLTGRQLVGRELAAELDLELDRAIHAQVPIEQVLVIHHGGDARDHQPARAARLRVAGPVLDVLPHESDVLLVHAYGLLHFVGLAAGVRERGVEVPYVTQAIAAQLERVRAVPQAVVAHVERALARVGRCGVPVGHGHLNERGAPQHGPVLEPDVAQDDPFAVVKSEVELPALPAHRGPVDREGGPLGLGDLERLRHVLAPLAREDLVPGQPVPMVIVRRRRHRGVRRLCLVDVHDLPRQQVDHGHAGDRVRVCVIGGVAATVEERLHQALRPAAHNVRLGRAAREVHAPGVLFE
mmetsp:Transcript_4506/g.18110  ORF Transcript_4506/g.18110 Transcript_4506/m.18110 type:complete len:401 (+) Transcript_4506:782-1984(+)